MTPPNVLGTLKPEVVGHDEQDVGRFLGGTMRGAHQAFDWRASSLITPTELRVGRRELLSIDGGGGAGSSQLTGDLAGP